MVTSEERKKKLKKQLQLMSMLYNLGFRDALIMHQALQAKLGILMILRGEGW